MEENDEHDEDVEIEEGRESGRGEDGEGTRSNQLV